MGRVSQLAGLAKLVQERLMTKLSQSGSSTELAGFKYQEKNLHFGAELPKLIFFSWRFRAQMKKEKSFSWLFKTGYLKILKSKS